MTYSAVWDTCRFQVQISYLQNSNFSDLIRSPFNRSRYDIGVGRFRILEGPRFRILGGGGQGEPIPSRHMTS